MTTPLRIAYAGTPEFAVPALQRIAASSNQLMCVITQPDRPAGRGRKLAESAVKAAAKHTQAAIFQPENINHPNSLEYLASLQLDVMVVAAYGQLFKQELLSLPGLGCINIHASLLPRWRGASPIQHAILHGDESSGVTIMQMAQAMDAGDIWMQQSCAIDAQDTAQSLHDRLAIAGAELILPALARVASHDYQAHAQASAAVSYCSKLHKTDGLIDWSQPGQAIDRQIRAFFPWPRAYTFLTGKRLGILSAQLVEQEQTYQRAGEIIATDKLGVDVATPKGVIRLQRLVPEGGRAVSAYEFSHAHSLLGAVLGDQP